LAKNHEREKEPLGLVALMKILRFGVTGRVGINYLHGKEMVLNRTRWCDMLRKARNVDIVQPDPHEDNG